MADRTRNHHCKVHPIGFDLCDMDMDLDISQWILEFLFRNVMDESLIEKAFLNLPLPDNCLRLKKTLLLRTIHSEILDGSVSEKMLDFLETVALMDREDGHVVFETVKSAYCAVAVDCTVRFAEENGNGMGQYFDAVKRIWRQRVESLEKADNVDLMSDQLRSWKDDIEAALYDDQVCKKLMSINTKKEALKAVTIYVTEAWKVMGPTFLELVNKKMGTSLMEAQKLSDHERGSLVEEGPPSLSNVRRSLVFCDESNMVNENCVGEKGASTQSLGKKCLMEDETQAVGRPASGDIGGGSKPVSIIENVVRNVKRDVGKIDQIITKMYDIVNTLNSGRMELADSDELRKWHNAQVQESDGLDANKQCGDGVTCCQGQGGRSKSAMQVKNQLDEMAGQLNNAQKKLSGTDQQNARDKDPDEDRNAMEISASASRHRGIDAVISSMRREHINADPSSETQDGIDVDVPIHSVGGNVEAIQANENNILDLVSRHKNDDPLARDESHVEASVPNPSVIKDSGVGDVQGSGANHGRCSSHQINEARASLMDGSTTQTYKWDDSIGDSSGSKCPPPPTKFIRRRAVKRWSNEEEDTLRIGVQKFGKGNWKMILLTYQHIFQERTQVDLKDKWRNMTK